MSEWFPSWRRPWKRARYWYALGLALALWGTAIRADVVAVHGVLILAVTVGVWGWRVWRGDW